MYLCLFDFSNSPPITLLKPNATSFEIIEAMKNPASGLNFINLQQNLPNLTFVTGDAVSWLLTHMEGLPTAEKGVQVIEVSFFKTG